MSQAVAKTQQQALDAQAIEAALIKGDLNQLSPQQRVSYYNNVCALVGLNPTTKPFDYLLLNGKLVLYPNKGCGEQLRQIHRISIRVTAREQIGDLYVVTADATLPDGRADSATGAVSVAGKRGEDLANAMMKAETKAKRRVTLSIVGLNMIDDTEVDSIPGAKRVSDPEAGASKARELEQRVTKNVTPIQPKAPEVLPPEAREPTDQELREAADRVVAEIKGEPPPPREDPGLYVCKFGKKFMGRMVKDIPLDQLEGFVAWLNQQETEEKPLSQFAAEFRAKALQHMGREPGSEG